MEKQIYYFGTPVKIGCDEQCNKAWGWRSRPTVTLDESAPQDFAYLSDDELGEAPANPDTYEGGDAKPTDTSQIPNKWCARECERCAMTQDGAPPELPDYTKRVYNQSWKHQ